MDDDSERLAHRLTLALQTIDAHLSHAYTISNRLLSVVKDEAVTRQSIAHSLEPWIRAFQQGFDQTDHVDTTHTTLTPTTTAPVALTLASSSCH